MKRLLALGLMAIAMPVNAQTMEELQLLYNYGVIGEKLGLVVCELTEFNSTDRELTYYALGKMSPQDKILITAAIEMPEGNIYRLALEYAFEATISSNPECYQMVERSRQK